MVKQGIYIEIYFTHHYTNQIQVIPVVKKQTVRFLDIWQKHVEQCLASKVSN